MSTFEDHLWSQLVSDHGEQIRQAKKETATLAASLRESSGRRRRRASRRSSRRQLVLAASTLGVACVGKRDHRRAHDDEESERPAHQSRRVRCHRQP